MSANDNFSLHDDEELSLHDDASLNGSEPVSNKGDAPAKPPQIITTNTLSNIKLPINEVWKVIQNGNSKKRVTKGKDGVYRVYLHPQAEQVADEKGSESLGTLLLMAVPKDHLRRFHGMDDAKEIWAAIKTRECKFKGTKDGSRQEASRGQDFKPVRTEKEALMTIDEGQINWVEQTTDEEINHALMAFTVNNEVSMCSKLCLDSYNALKAKYDELQSEFGDQEAALTAHKIGLKKVEAQLNASHKQQISLNEKLLFQANQIFEKDEKLKKYRRIGMKAVKDKDALQKIVDSWFASSKNLWKLIDCGMSSTVKLGLGYSIKSNAEVLSYEEEMDRGIFASIRETDPGYHDIPLYSRFKQVENKGVPHPLSGDYTPREQEDIDDSLYEYGKYGPQPQTPSPTVSNASSISFSICPSNDSDGDLGTVSGVSSTHYSTCQSNDSVGEPGTVSDHSVNDDPVSTQKTQPKVPTTTQTVDPSCAQHVKPPRQPIRTPVTSSPIPLNNRQNWNQRIQRDLGAGFSFERKPCFVCGSLSHLIKNCDYYEKKMAREAALKSKRVVNTNDRQATPAWNNTNRINKANQFTPRPVNVRPNLSTASNTIKTGRVNGNTGNGNINSDSVHVNAGTQVKSGTSRFNTGKQHVNSGSVYVNSVTQIKSAASRVNTGKRYINSGCVHINTARVNRPMSNKPNPKPSQVKFNSKNKYFSKQSSPANRPFSRNTAYRSNIYAVKGKMGTAVKTSAGCVWRKTSPLSITNSGPIPDSYVHDHPLKHMEHRGIFDSGCSGHMTGNRAHLEDYQELSKVGSVTFGGSKGSISGKGTIRLGNLVFDDVAFVKELGHFNLFSISQICDKKLNVLFTEKECFVVSSDFKMPDENQVLLKVPRQHNMYTFDMKNVDSSKAYTCLLAKASSNEAKLWHRRLGHLNFKNLNKLVKDNLVRGLPSKSFKNDHTCVACQKGKQHKASCKAKMDRYVTHPLHTLHMDLFGPTSVRSINHASYCLVITDDCSRFCWVFFLAKKDETSGILKTFIKQIENQLNQKVKIIRSDNGTEFKNRVMLEFCGEKGIKQEFSNARTPQQNGVAERMNRTLIEAARTMLADSLLPTTFWAEAVNTACYTFNRVRVTKPQNKTPYELLFGHKPILSYIRPFGCHVTILNTLSPLGKFDGKSDEGFLVGYSVNSKAFRVYNLATKRVEVNLHVNFLEEKPNVQGLGHRWMFDLDYLTDSMNYIPVSLQNQANPAGSKEVIDIDVQTEEAEELLVVSSTSRKAADVEKIHTDLNVADLLTKPFDGPRYYLVLKRVKQDQLGHGKESARCHLLIGCNLVIQIFSPSVSMAQLKYCDKHNQVGFLLKPTESAGYTEIVDFLRRSKLRYALTHNPPIYDSLVKQFWQTATARTLADGTQQLNATIDTIEYTITEESVRRQLQLADASGIHMLQNEEIFAGLQNIGSKSGGWDQFGSNIAIALICLSTGRDFNFSKLIFDGMISNLKSQPQPSADPTQSHVQPTAITPPTQPVQTTSPPPVSSIPDIQPTLPPSPQIPSPSFHDTEGPSFEPSYHMSPPPSLEPEFQASRSSEESEQLRNLLDIVPRLQSRVESLEKELSETKQTLGTAVLQLTEKVKKLENKLRKKRKSKETKDAEDQAHETHTHTSKGGGSREWGLLHPSTLEAAQILTIVASEGFKGSQAPLGSKIYKRKSKSTKTPTKILHFEEPDSAQVNTAQVNTAELNPDSTPSAQINTGERKGAKTEEDLKLKIKHQKHQKSFKVSDLEEAKRSQAEMDSGNTKQIDLEHF
ncbi:putative ribonuclease H-like domain-containing protein [Tanacetum coccineum]